jgi:hypothetical protein
VVADCDLVISGFPGAPYVVNNKGKLLQLGRRGAHALHGLLVALGHGPRSGMTAEELIQPYRDWRGKGQVGSVTGLMYQLARSSDTTLAESIEAAHRGEKLKYRDVLANIATIVKVGPAWTPERIATARRLLVNECEGVELSEENISRQMSNLRSCLVNIGVKGLVETVAGRPTKYRLNPRVRSCLLVE